jgi:FkbM family methyltransferase
MPRGSVLWDIGANVGLYSCYAVKARDCRVFAFEPSVFNLELLARNIFLNGIADQATMFF